MSPPEVSVVIPVYNRSRKVLEAASSVLRQTNISFELIVVDDGSEEDQREIRQLLDSSGQKYHSQENRGVSVARNVGAQLATGKYLAFLDSDDLWLPEKLSKQVELLESSPELRVCQCREIWFRKGVRVNQKQIHEMPRGDVFRPSLERCLISPSSVIMQSSLFRELGGFDERFKVCEDYELWLRLSANEPVGLLDEALVEKYGGHQDQLSQALPAMDRFRVLAMLKLLLNESLNEEQLCSCLEMLSQKADIVGLGAWKRGLPYANLYGSLAKDAAQLSRDNLSLVLEPYYQQIVSMLVESGELFCGS